MNREANTYIYFFNATFPVNTAGLVSSFSFWHVTLIQMKDCAEVLSARRTELHSFIM